MRMILSRRAFCCKINYLAKFSSTNPSLESYILDSKFTDIEKEIILTTLNSSNAEELSKFNVTQGRLRNLVSQKKKKGPFTSLSDILEVDGLGVNILDKLCQSILAGDTNITINKQKNKNIVTPVLSKYNANCITSAVGLHIETTGISWAKLQSNDNKLSNWNYCDFSTLPKKVLPIDTFNLATKILHSIPPADIYIFENKQSNGLSKASTTIPIHNHHQLELASMLLALINTSNNYILENKNAATNRYENKVYFLRNRLPARLFGVLVGTERVSTENIVLNIINGKTDESLPCSKVVVGPELANDYCKCPKGYKDLLEQALLLVVTFMEVCVYNNPVSLKIIGKLRK